MSEATEREKFEAWAKEQGFSVERGSTGLYRSLGTNQLFSGWLGCASQPVAAAPVKQAPIYVVLKDGAVLATHDGPCHLDGIQGVRYLPANNEQDARRYQWLRSEGLMHIRWEGLTSETCDIGLDYAIDTRLAAAPVGVRGSGVGDSTTASSETVQGGGSQCAA